MTTLKEMVEERESIYVDTDYRGGVFGCPSGYTYLSVKYDLCFDENGDCDKCWNQEYKGEND